jgi:putative ABC transport system permease protein
MLQCLSPDLGGFEQFAPLTTMGWLLCEIRKYHAYLSVTAMLSLRIAFRNLFRHRRRSLLTGLIVFWGCLILSVMLGLTDGTYRHVIDRFARGWTGYIQIHHRNFYGACSQDTVIGDYPSLMQSIRADPRVDGVAARIKVPMFVSASNNSGNAFVMGIDPVVEAEVFGLDKRVRSGRYLRSDEKRSILLGQTLFEHLGLRLDEAVVLLGYGADGSLANGKYTVVGTVVSGDQQRDASFAYLPLMEAMELTALEGGVQELAVVTKPGADMDELAASLRTRLASRQVRVETWHEFARGFFRAVQADASTKALAVWIVVCVVGLGVWTTMLMNVLERYREFSLMRALGTSRRFVAAMIVTEALLLTLPAAILAAASGILANDWLATRGLPLTSSLSYGGMQFDALYTTVSARSIYVPLACVLIAALLVAVFSALQAIRVAPADGMRKA